MHPRGELRPIHARRADEPEPVEAQPRRVGRTPTPVAVVGRCSAVSVGLCWPRHRPLLTGHGSTSTQPASINPLPAGTPWSLPGPQMCPRTAACSGQGRGAPGVGAQVWGCRAGGTPACLLRAGLPASGCCTGRVVCPSAGRATPAPGYPRGHTPAPACRPGRNATPTLHAPSIAPFFRQTPGRRP